MSDVNFNVTTTLPSTIAGGGSVVDFGEDALPGGYSVVATNVWEDVGMAVSATAVDTDTIFAINFLAGFTAAAAQTVRLGISVDGGSVVPVGVQRIPSGGNTSSCNSVFYINNLSSGVHTFRLHIFTDNSVSLVASSASNPETTLQVVTHASATGGGAIKEITEASITTDFNITNVWADVAGGNMMDITGMSVNINTVANERVLLMFTGMYYLSSATDNGFVIGYSVDGGTPISVTYDLARENTAVRTLSFSLFTDALSAGNHTIQLTGAAITASPPLILRAGFPNLSQVKLQAIQFQGTNGAAEWQTFTPTGNWTNTTYTGQYRHTGDTLQVRVAAACTGAPSAGALEIDLPPGFTIDTTKLPQGTEPNQYLGGCRVLDGGTTTYAGTVAYQSTTSVTFTTDSNAGNGQQATVSTTAPFTFGSGDHVNAWFEVPVL